MYIYIYIYIYIVYYRAGGTSAADARVSPACVLCAGHGTRAPKLHVISRSLSLSLFVSLSLYIYICIRASIAQLVDSRSCLRKDLSSIPASATAEWVTKKPLPSKSAEESQP